MCRVTVVDDEPEILEVLCVLLHEEGHEVAGIGHPSLIASLKTSPWPDLFVIDLMLPGMSGVELARRLQLEGCIDTPMIAISASSSMLRQAVKSGLFRDALEKPFDLEELVGCVERHLHSGDAA